MTRRRADLTLLLATAMWGTSFVAVKTGLAYATPLAFLAVRFGIAALLLAPGTRFTPLPRGRELWGGLLLGALVAVGFVSVTFGLLVTTPSRSAFIVAISSVLAPVIGFVVLGQRPGWLAAAALALAGVGMYFLTAPDSGGLNRGTTKPITGASTDEMATMNAERDGVVTRSPKVTDTNPSATRAPSNRPPHSSRPRGRGVKRVPGASSSAAIPKRTARNASGVA